MQQSAISGGTARHLNFALTKDEIKLCARCGNLPRARPYALYPRLWSGDVSVTLGGPHAIAGIVKICDSCAYPCTRNDRNQFINEWRKTAPPSIQIIPGKPIQLVVRGRCDDELLARVIRDAFERVPERSRRKILEYVLTKWDHTTTGKGMRFEALSWWPRMGDAAGINMDRGHAIRLRASVVKPCLSKAATTSDAAELIEIITHELAHTEQHADGKRFNCSDECERDVEDRLRTWGFDCGPTRADKAVMLARLDRIIDQANAAKAIIRRGKMPSGNFAWDAVSQAEKAEKCLMQASWKWRGID